jgi:hypothetical protein
MTKRGIGGVANSSLLIQANPTSSGGNRDEGTSQSAGR